jgi:hypothetical protein
MLTAVAQGTARRPGLTDNIDGQGPADGPVKGSDALFG